MQANTNTNTNTNTNETENAMYSTATNAVKAAVSAAEGASKKWQAAGEKPEPRVVYLVIKEAQAQAKCDSSKLCVKDALQLWRGGSFRYAGNRALKSLAYSVGVFSPIYIEAQEKLK